MKKKVKELVPGEYFTCDNRQFLRISLEGVDNSNVYWCLDILSGYLAVDIDPETCVQTYTDDRI